MGRHISNNPIEETDGHSHMSRRTVARDTTRYQALVGLLRSVEFA